MGKFVFSTPIAQDGNNELAPPAKAAVMTLRLLVKFSEFINVSSAHSYLGIMLIWINIAHKDSAYG